MWPLSMDSRTQSIWALSEIEINSLDLASPERFISQLCWVFTRWVRVGTGLLSLDLFGVQFQLPLSISLKCSPLSSGFWMKRFSPLPLVAIFRPLGTVSSVWRSLYDTVTLFLSSDLIRQQWPLSLDFFRTRLVLWFAVSSDFFLFFPGPGSLVSPQWNTSQTVSCAETFKADERGLYVLCWQLEFSSFVWLRVYSFSSGLQVIRFVYIV